VADTLSRLDISDEEFGPDCFAADDECYYPLTYEKIRVEQSRDNKLQEDFRAGKRGYKKVTFKHSDNSYELICNKEDKILLPKPLQVPAVDWYHTHLMHPGETRMELTMGQHYYWKGMRPTIQAFCKLCGVCKRTRK